MNDIKRFTYHAGAGFVSSFLSNFHQKWEHIYKYIEAKSIILLFHALNSPSIVLFVASKFKLFKLSDV